MACKIDGFPKPKVTWFRNGEPLQASTRYTTLYDINTGVARLKIADSHLADTGQFSVLAENKAGHDSTDCRLDVKKSANIDNSPIVNPNAFAYLNRQPEAPTRRRSPESERAAKPARVVIPLKNITTQEGKPITLACKVEGEPTPQIAWYKNGRPLLASTRLNPQFDLPTQVASLKIPDSSTFDSGHYEVIVENPTGQDRTSANVLVHPVAPVQSESLLPPREPPTRPVNSVADREPMDSDEMHPPKVIVPLQNAKFKEGSQLVLACKITGNPKPKITWLKD